MASQLRRSADQLSKEAPTTSRPSTGTTKKQRSTHSSSSSSSNELNISRPEANLDDNDDYPCLAQSTSEDGVPKVSNLNPAASDDEYARLKVNNFDVSVDSGKRGAYAKFEDEFNVTASTALEDSDTSHNNTAETEVLSSQINF
ncbi:uncharacterized protein LOC121865324 [Homarus americanus]|uniref:Uncharacterized protein n=2 Tax=Homarus americanus TaxID=6706 RepID=A0A8J5KA60_HOMAM|nr:uncharacterized protein LOC121865324 [Homarus americanus]KAG7169814.1 hypothetical protein Hamer_G029311 [Homarus americanus]